MQEHFAQRSISAWHFPSTVDAWLSMPHQHHLNSLPLHRAFCSTIDLPLVWFTPSTRSSLKSNVSLKSSSIEQLPLDICAESTTKYAQMKLFKGHALTSLVMFVIDHLCSDSWISEGKSAPPLLTLALTHCCQIEVIVHLPPIH